MNETRETIQPNTTQVPNIILDEWLFRLKDTEFRVLMIVVRQTLGWIEDLETGKRKEKDWISSSQLVAKSGRTRKHISRAIGVLVDELRLVEALDEKGKLLDSPQKRGKKFGKIFYRLALHAPAVTLFDKPRLNEAIESRASKGLTIEEEGTKGRTQKGRTTKETQLQNLYILPDWLNKVAWGEWEAYRSEKGKKLTKTSVKLQLEMLSKNVPDHAEIIRTSIRNGWTGLFPLKKNLPMQPGRSPSFNSRTLDAARAHEKRMKEEEERREFDENMKHNDELRKIKAMQDGLKNHMKI